LEVSIQRLDIKNFQSHEQSTIHFKEGINVICGSSNNGKSSVLRAIQWVISNQPGGTEFITIGKDECSVTIHLSNGYNVTRTKSRSGNVNTYLIKKGGTAIHDNPLTGFGGSVPSEVRDAIGVSRSEYIFANQLEAPFLISDSPKVRSEKIGNLEELGRIDQALTGVNDDIRLQSKLSKSLDVEIKKHKKEAEDLSEEINKEQRFISKLNRLHQDVMRQVAIAEQLEQIVSKWKVNENTMDEIEKVVSQANRILSHYPEHLPKTYEQYEVLVQKQKRMCEVEKELNSIVVIDEHVLKLLISYSDFVETEILKFSLIERIRDSLSECKRSFEDATRDLKSKVTNVDISTLEKEIGIFQKGSSMQTKLQQTATEIDCNEVVKKDSSARLSELIDELIDYLQSEKKCPVCAQDTEHVHLDPHHFI
jgi:exonuclease SbcC